MATDLENLTTRRSAIYAELAALSSTASGGKPTYSADGENVDHVGYKDGLYRELAALNALLAAAAGPFEVETRGIT